jgi:hypothetical protein
VSGLRTANAERRAANGERSQVVPLILAWIVIAVPLGWGVAQTVVKALALFR